VLIDEHITTQFLPVFLVTDAAIRPKNSSRRNALSCCQIWGDFFCAL